MPKEIVHMGLADRVSSKIRKGSAFRGPVRKHPSLFCYGAVAPDTGSYYLKGPRSKRVQLAGRKFHVHTAAAINPVIDLLNQKSAQPDAVLAFAAGVFCHIIADTIFHPMIYYFCGLDQVHKGATERHRLFETVMDAYADIYADGFSARKVKTVFAGVECRPSQASRLLEMLMFGPDKQMQAYTKVALRCHHLGTFCFTRPWIVSFAAALGRPLPLLLTTLFYSRENRPDPHFFASHIQYQDPETGEKFNNTFEDLSKKVVSATLALLDYVEACLDQGENVDDAVLFEKDIRIRPCPPLTRDKFRFWRKQPGIRSLICETSVEK